MKKTIITLLAAAAAVFAFTPSNAEAGGYQSRVISRCGHCNQNVYAYYRPVSYCNSRPVYGWVPSQHSNCGGSQRGSRGYGSSQGHGSSYGSRGTSFQFSYRSGTPSYGRGYSSGSRYSSYPSRGYRSSGSCR